MSKSAFNKFPYRRKAKFLLIEYWDQRQKNLKSLLRRVFGLSVPIQHRKSEHVAAAKSLGVSLLLDIVV